MAWCHHINGKALSGDKLMAFVFGPAQVGAWWARYWGGKLDFDHLAISTPRANFVDCMRWPQGHVCPPCGNVAKNDESGFLFPKLDAFAARSKTLILN